MSRYLILDWGLEAISVVVASAQRKGRVVVEQAFTVAGAGSSTSETAETADARDAGANEEALVERLREAVRRRGLSRLETIVVLGRNDVEIRRMSLPPAPDDELPDMVRFQAMREFNALTEAWPLDYLPLSDRADAPRPVMAAAVNPAWIERIQRVCAAAHLRVEHMLLKSGGTAALWSRDLQFDADKVDMIIALADGEADLIVTADGRVVFLRTARLYADPLSSVEQTGGLEAEIRRTMMAAHSQLGERRVDRLVLCGSTDAHTALVAALEQKLSLPAIAFDALKGVELSGEAAGLDATSLAPYVPLLGLLVEQVDPQARPIFDFSNPRRAPEPTGRRNQITLAVAAAVLAGLSLVGWLWYQNYQRGREIRALQNTQSKLTKSLPRAQARAEQALAVKAWEDQRLDWIKELEWFARSLPPAEQVLVTKLQLHAAATGAGRITFDGYVRDFATFGPMEQALRDAHHLVEVGDKVEDTSEPRYGYRLEPTTIWITPPSRRDETTPIEQPNPPAE